MAESKLQDREEMISENGQNIVGDKKQKLVSPMRFVPGLSKESKVQGNCRSVPISPRRNYME